MAKLKFKSRTAVYAISLAVLFLVGVSNPEPVASVATGFICAVVKCEDESKFADDEVFRE